MLNFFFFFLNSLCCFVASLRMSFVLIVKQIDVCDVVKELLLDQIMLTLFLLFTVEFPFRDSPSLFCFVCLFFLLKPKNSAQKKKKKKVNRRHEKIME